MLKTDNNFFTSVESQKYLAKTDWNNPYRAKLSGMYNFQERKVKESPKAVTKFLFQQRFKNATLRMIG